MVLAASNAGKTTLLKTLKDVFIISRDGKKYPFPQPHYNVPDFKDVDELIDGIVEKINMYEEKFGELPKIIAIDTISKILLDIEAGILEKVADFPYGKIGAEVSKFVHFIERDLVENFDVIVLSHAMYDEKLKRYVAVNPGGSYKNRGGFLSEVNEAIFIEALGEKRTVYFRNVKRCSRTLCDDFPEKMLLEDFTLQSHIEKLRELNTDTEEWEFN
jgi:hypothetical protein